ncbi:MAG TPA: elongation factor P [Fimbriimonadaceae bacterium]|nr:elongation factor P [Fimbriimonadaceae bacterium]
MAIDTSDFRGGLAIYLDGEVHQIIDFQHVKPGKGGAFVRTKLKRLRTGATVEKTFRAGEKMDSAYLEKKAYQFLYRQGDELVLMDLETYEQNPVAASVIGDSAKYLMEEMEIQALVADGQILGYEVPNFVELTVTETDPAFKGDTVGGGATKPAKLESGATVQVPFHIAEGDRIKVDTRTGEYLERTSKK